MTVLIIEKRRKLLRRVIILGGILIILIMDLLLYWNQYVLQSAESLGDHEKKIALLKDAARIYPLNDLVNLEIGKSLYNLAKKDLSNSKSLEYIDRAIEEFVYHVSSTHLRF